HRDTHGPTGGMPRRRGVVGHGPELYGPSASVEALQGVRHVQSLPAPEWDTDLEEVGDRVIYLVVVHVGDMHLAALVGRVVDRVGDGPGDRHAPGARVHQHQQD